MSGENILDTHIIRLFEAADGLRHHSMDSHGDLCMAKGTQDIETNYSI